MRRRLRRFDLLLGVGASAVVLVILLQRPPGWEAAAIVGATLLPAGVVLYGAAAARRARELRNQRDLARREAERIEASRAELERQQAEAQQRLAELVTLNELGIALSSTLDLDELLDRSLQAVVGHLRFDRALVLLVDEGRGVLAGGRSVGGTPEMGARIAALELPLDLHTSLLVQLARADGPMLFTSVGDDPDERNRAFAQALGVDSFLGTPLITKGRTVGVLAVDNRDSGREVARAAGPLLYTLGNLIASAIETARLYGEIEAQNRELEARVEERTRELALATGEAEEARAAAVEASETKSRFLANVSHELRTPLTSILGFTKIIRRRLDEAILPHVTSDDPKTQRAVRQVSENLDIITIEGDRLTHMINDVLDLAKIEAGKLDWREGPVDALELVERAAAATASLFEASGVELVRDVAADLPTTVGDRDRLIQVLINLFSNAVKFTPHGTVTCRVRRDGETLVFSVTDTGVGIDPADHARVFEQFAQAGDTLTDKPRGTGLGLPISRQIVEHHGGRMWLESTIGTGSTFSFSLPVREAVSAQIV